MQLKEMCEKLTAGRTMALRPDLGIPNAALHSGSAVTAAMLATIITSPADCVKVRPHTNILISSRNEGS